MAGVGSSSTMKDGLSQPLIAVPWLTVGRELVKVEVINLSTDGEHGLLVRSGRGPKIYEWSLRGGRELRGGGCHMVPAGWRGKKKREKGKERTRFLDKVDT